MQKSTAQTIEAITRQIGMQIKNDDVAAVFGALNDPAQETQVYASIRAGLEVALCDRGWKHAKPLTAAECLTFFPNVTESGFRRMATKHGLKKVKWKNEKVPRYLRAEVMKMSKQRYTVAKQISEWNERFHKHCLTL